MKKLNLSHDFVGQELGGAGLRLAGWFFCPVSHPWRSPGGIQLVVGHSGGPVPLPSRVWCLHGGGWKAGAAVAVTCRRLPQHGVPGTGSAQGSWSECPQRQHRGRKGLLHVAVGNPNSLTATALGLASIQEAGIRLPLRGRGRDHIHP